MKDETPRHSVSRRLSPLKEEEIRPAADEAPRQPAKLKPRPPPVSTSRDSSPAESKTFLTALVPAGRRQNEALRPPSPLESLEPSSDYVDTEPANYMGMEAMQQFWGIFHRQETVHNNKAVPPTVSSVVARPKSARTNYLAAVRNLRLCPEPLGINRFGAPGMLAVARFLEETLRIEERIWPGINYGALRHSSITRLCVCVTCRGSSSGPSSALVLENHQQQLGWSAETRAVVTALADSLANNKVLAHLDLSSNRLDLEDCTLLAKQLENNQH
ncbi:Leucine-rich repeat domain, L domain-like [Phytophthora cactorum]|nr:Leucine-rich repeat domain, L domain-like [Phytophthora cactorum]